MTTTLYYSPASCAMASRITLEELGVSYALRLFNSRNGETRTETYRAIHPMQKVPVLDDGDFRLTETVAILTYLADRYDAREALLPREDVHARARVLEGLARMSSGLHPVYRRLFRPEDFSKDQGNWSEARNQAFVELRRWLALLDDSVDEEGFLVGGRHSLADILALVYFTWTVRPVVREEIPPLPGLARLAARVGARPAAARVLVSDGVEPFWGDWA